MRNSDILRRIIIDMGCIVRKEGLENVTLTGHTEVTEMWLYQPMLRIPWTDYVRNRDVLRRIGITKKMLTTIKENCNF